MHLADGWGLITMKQQSDQQSYYNCTSYQAKNSNNEEDRKAPTFDVALI